MTQDNGDLEQKPSALPLALLGIFGLVAGGGVGWVVTMPQAERASFLHQPSTGQSPSTLQQPSMLQQPGLLLEPDETTVQQVEQQAQAEMRAPRSDQQFGGCNDARAAGQENIMRGDPSYREDMDGDHDGIACEPYRDSGGGGGGRRGRRF